MRRGTPARTRRPTRRRNRSRRRSDFSRDAPWRIAASAFAAKAVLTGPAHGLGGEGVAIGAPRERPESLLFQTP